jgi:hypothetical protein
MFESLFDFVNIVKLREGTDRYGCNAASLAGRGRDKGLVGTNPTKKYVGNRDHSTKKSLTYEHSLPNESLREMVSKGINHILLSTRRVYTVGGLPILTSIVILSPIKKKGKK